MSNETKQTAIDIFKEKLIDIFEDYHDGIITLDEYIESINKATQQAKEIEREQMMNAFQEGVEIPYIEMKGDRTLFIKPSDSFFYAENYYNETYGGNK